MELSTALADGAGEPGLPPREPGAARLLAARLFFAAPFHQVSDELYRTVGQGKAVTDRHRAVVEPHSRVSTNSYFGRFPASYWQRWTAVTEVTLEATVSGTGRLTVVASDAHGVTRTVGTAFVDTAGIETAGVDTTGLDTVGVDTTGVDTTGVDTAGIADGGAGRELRITAQLDRFVDGGALWLELATQAGTLTVRNARWSVAAPPQLRPTAVVICTFNRPDDCLHTLDVLSGDPDAMRMVDAVYVVDQGTETLESRDGFARVQASLGAKLRYRRQANLGGAGGFTRGLYEVAEAPHTEHANVLFMDDDILLEPDTVNRMTAFANRACEPVIVGAQMLYLLHPTLIYSWAQTTDLPRLEAGVPVPGDVLRVDVTRHRQDTRVEAGYNAWWSCLVPAEIVAAAGYPLPLFFQWDDVEYGLRARAHGYPTVTLAGVGVWHADWDWKDEDNWSNYFNHRNVLIVNALHGDFDAKGSARVVRERLLRYLVTMRYGLAATVIKAVEDFLDGPECLRDGGVEAAAAVHKLRATYPETQRYHAHDIPGVPSAAMPRVPGEPAPSRENAVMAKRLIWQLLRKPTGTAAVSERDARWWLVSRFRVAVVTDASQQGVRVVRLDRDQLITLGRRAWRVLRRLRREGARVQQQYRAALPELTSRQNWQRLFEQPDQ